MEAIGKRIIWLKYLLLFLSLSMICVDIWLFYSLIMSKELDFLLVSMAFIVLTIAFILFTFTLLNFIKKRDAIIIKNNQVITYEYKEIVTDFKNIKNIQYSLSTRGKLGIYRSGKIIFTLINDEKIIVRDIVDARNVCQRLRQLILITKN